MADYLLAGDVGGHRTSLALFPADDHELVPARDVVLDSSGFTDFGEAVSKFLGEGKAKGGQHVVAAAFGIPGPVVDNVVVATRMPWQGIDADDLGERIGCSKVRLLNDLQTLAEGSLKLRASDEQIVNPGVPRPGTRAVVAVGTGLGQAILHQDGRKWHAVPTEGGHADFAPIDDVGVEFWKWMRAELSGRVSIERMLSGSGLLNLFRFLMTKMGRRPASMVVEGMRTAKDPVALICQAALERVCPCSEEALETFVRYFGAHVGNVALEVMAVGGVWIGGGIPYRILPALTRGGLTGPFLEAFRDKGRYKPRLSEIPVKVILNPRTALLGAARAARALHRGDRVSGTGSTNKLVDPNL